MDEFAWDRRTTLASMTPGSPASAMPWIALGTGILGALAAQLILLLLGAECAVAVLLAAPNANGALWAGVLSAAWSVLAAVAAPFVGGLMAGGTHWRGGPTSRALGGLVIWAVNVLVTLWFGYTNVASMTHVAAGPAVAHADRVLPTLQQYLPGVVAHAAREGSAAGPLGAGILWTVALTLLFSCCAAMLGTLLGARALPATEAEREIRPARPSFFDWRQSIA